MKIFQSVLKHFATLGISSSSSYQSTQKYPFNKRIFFGCTLLGWAIISQFVYIFRVANNFMEYVECVCLISGTTIVLICLATIAFRRTLLFSGIRELENLIETIKSFFDYRYTQRFESKPPFSTIKLCILGCKHPKSLAHFSRTNEQIEKLTELVFMLVVEIFLQLVMLPRCIVSFIVYFVTDSGCDSFELPLPMW